MPRPYSNDLRRRVVRAIENGASYRGAAGLFQVSISFVVKLMQRVRRSGTVTPDQIGGSKTSSLQLHTEKLRRWITERPDITVAELHARLVEQGIETSPAAVAVRRTPPRTSALRS